MPVRQVADEPPNRRRQPCRKLPEFEEKRPGIVQPGDLVVHVGLTEFHEVDERTES